MGQISNEARRKVFDLTLALYRVTDFFPQGEALRKYLRERANDIFGMISEYGFTADRERDSTFILSKIEAVRGYLNLARSLRFVKPLNLAVLEREYNWLYDFFSKELSNIQKYGGEDQLKSWLEFSSERQESVENKQQKGANNSRRMPKSTPILSEPDAKISERQQKIVQHLKEVEHAKISDFFSVFSDISSKTIQRDLQDLISRKMLKKGGEKRWTVYSLNSGKDGMSDMV